MTDSLMIAVQGVDRTQMAQVWAKMKAGQPLEGREIYIGQAMAEHPQWFSYFDTLSNDSDQMTQNNETLGHVAFHMAIGSQIFTSKPPEAEIFYRIRLRKGDKPHDVIHMMIAIYQQHLLWKTQGTNAPQDSFDWAAYGQSLRSLWGLKCQKLLEKLEVEAGYFSRDGS